jgi:hypothetical protein
MKSEPQRTAPRRRLMISPEVLRPPALPPLASHAELSTLLERAQELESLARTQRAVAEDAASSAHATATAARDRHEAARAMVRALDRLIHFEPRTASHAPADETA